MVDFEEGEKLYVVIPVQQPDRVVGYNFVEQLSNGQISVKTMTGFIIPVELGWIYKDSQEAKVQNAI